VLVLRRVVLPPPMLEVPHIAHFHTFRVAQEFLGHSSPEMTARYVHVTRPDLLRASQASRLAA